MPTNRRPDASPPPAHGSLRGIFNGSQITNGKTLLPGAQAIAVGQALL